jgi:hypothetical protein
VSQPAPSRSSRSTARTWAAPSAGPRNDDAWEEVGRCPQNHYRTLGKDEQSQHYEGVGTVQAILTIYIGLALVGGVAPLSVSFCASLTPLRYLGKKPTPNG